MPKQTRKGESLYGGGFQQSLKEWVGFGRWEAAGWLTSWLKDFLVGRGEKNLSSPAGFLVGRCWPGVGTLLILSGLNPMSPSFRNNRISPLPQCPLCTGASSTLYPLLRNLGYSCIDGGLLGLGTGIKFLGTRRVELGDIVKGGHSKRYWGLWLHICAPLSSVSARSLLRWVTEVWQYQDAWGVGAGGPIGQPFSLVCTLVKPFFPDALYK